MRVDSNTVDVFWTLGGVLAWVMFRDLKYAQEFSEEGKSAAVLGILGALPRMHGEPKQKPLMSIRAAKALIQKKLVAGSLQCTGMPTLYSPRQQIPANEWINNDFAFMPDSATVSREMGVRHRPSWVSVRFKAADAIKLWPAEGPVRLVQPASENTNIFCKQGDLWALVFDGKYTGIKHCRGMHYLERLLKQPNKSIHCLDLIAAVTPPEKRGMVISDEEIESFSSQGHVSAPENAIEIFDRETQNNVKKEMSRLQAARERAIEFEDVDKITKIDDELSNLARYFNSGSDIKGSIKKVGGTTEKARISVKKAIETAVKRIEADNKELAKYLRSTIKTGFECTYSPETDVPWQFSRKTE